MTTRDQTCAFVQTNVERDRLVEAFFTEGLGAREACRYVGRCDDGRRPAATMADNGVDVRLFAASRPWTTVTSGVLDVDRLIESAYAWPGRSPPWTGTASPAGSSPCIP